MSTMECPPTPPTLPEGDAARTPPPKSEDGELEKTQNPSSDATARNGRPSSPDPNCAICLGKLENMSYTDSCFHKFCFTCLLEWSKVKPECPLCKAKFKSIIHTIQSDQVYKSYTLPPPPAEPPRGPAIIGEYLQEMRRFRYQTTMTGDRQAAFQQRDHSFILPTTFSMDRLEQQVRTVRTSAAPLWTRRRGAATSEFRRDIYRRNLYVEPESVVDVTGRYRDTSPGWYRTNPAQTHRLVPWLNRELNALLEATPHQSTYVTQLILDLIQRFHITSPEFTDRLLPYTGTRTDHFQHELYHFARSVYDMIGYDHNATYGPPRQLATEVISSEHSSDNRDDVIVVDEVRRRNNVNISYNAVGPSTSMGETSSQQQPFNRIVIPPDSEDSDGGGEQDDHVEVVGYVKPRHERTPVIINLSSSDGEKHQKSTTYKVEQPDNSSTVPILISSGEEDFEFSDVRRDPANFVESVLVVTPSSSSSSFSSSSSALSSSSQFSEQRRQKDLLAKVKKSSRKDRRRRAETRREIRLSLAKGKGKATSSCDGFVDKKGKGKGKGKSSSRDSKTEQTTNSGSKRRKSASSFSEVEQSRKRRKTVEEEDYFEDEKPLSTWRVEKKKSKKDTKEKKRSEMMPVEEPVASTSKGDLRLKLSRKIQWFSTSSSSSSSSWSSDSDEKKKKVKSLVIKVDHNRRR